MFEDSDKWIGLGIDRTNWKFGKCNINILFIGNQWITYLKDLPFTFFIRIRNNILANKIVNSEQKHAKHLFNFSYFRALRNRRVLFGHRIYIGGQKIGMNEWSSNSNKNLKKRKKV